MATRIEIGRFQELEVVEQVDGGVLLDGDGPDLFLPTHLCPAGCAVGHRVKVFIFCDHDGKPMATTATPAASVGEIAALQCVAVTAAGAYLAWGLPKDLYAPPTEQRTPMVQGRRYVAAVCLDKKGTQLIASTRLARRFDPDLRHLAPDQEVDLLVIGAVDAGVRVVVNRRHRGLVHTSDVVGELRIGTEHRGYVRKIRDDGRLDIVLARRGAAGMDDAQTVILRALEQAGGSLPLHDGSTPQQIGNALGLSKKAFKRGIGGLYKARRIVLREGGIALVDCG